MDLERFQTVSQVRNKRYRNRDLIFLDPVTNITGQLYVQRAFRLGVQEDAYRELGRHKPSLRMSNKRSLLWDMMMAGRVITLYAFREEVRSRNRGADTSWTNRSRIFELMSVCSVKTTLYALRPDVKRRNLETYRRTLHTGLHGTVLYGLTGPVFEF